MKHDGALAAAQSDTTPKAHARYLQRLAEAGPHEKLARALALSNRLLSATMAELRRSMPNATRGELAVAFVRRVYGEALASRFEARLACR